MMKKLLILLALAVAVTSAFAEDYAGVWQDPEYGRAVLTILPDGEKYDIALNWGGSFDTRGEWRMEGHVDGGKLVYENGTMAEATYGEGGVPVSSDVKWSDAAGELVLAEDGALTWTDSREERAADFRFQRAVRPAPGAGELVSEYLEVVARQEAGSAGYTLKLAKAAYTVLRFARDNQLWNADPDALRENLSAAWDAIGEERQQRFDENFAEVSSLMDEAFANYDDARYPFEDAGVGDEMAALVADPEARLSWEALAGTTQG